MQDLHGGVHERDPLPDRGEVLRFGGDFLGLHGLQERDQCEGEFLERGQLDGGGRAHEVGQAAEDDIVMLLFLIQRHPALQLLEGDLDLLDPLQPFLGKQLEDFFLKLVFARVHRRSQLYRFSPSFSDGRPGGASKAVMVRVGPRFAWLGGRILSASAGVFPPKRRPAPAPPAVSAARPCALRLLQAGPRGP